MNAMIKLLLASITAASVALAGCATQPADVADRTAAGAPRVAQAGAPVARWSVDADLAQRILALDAEHISDRDVRETLAKGPTPRIMLLHGGVFPVHLVMESFGAFLTAMGYPEAQIRDPGDGGWSYSPYLRTPQLAGLAAWQYEHDGVRPMLVGHSQGGLSAVKILKDLAGQNGDSVRVWNPLTATLEERTTIVDPMTGRERPVVGVSVAYASAVGAGGFALILPGWWENLETLRRIPDTVDEFTGYFIEVDLFALSLPGNPLDRRYENGGKARVRNVTLPATYSHVIVPLTASLADDPRVRDWVNAYSPDGRHDTSSLPGAAADHVLWAADVWYSIKKHWCLEAQRWVRAQRERGTTESRPRAP
jgi:hypothetical protein